MECWNIGMSEQWGVGTMGGTWIWAAHRRSPC